MAVPKSKITKSKRNMRRAHDALSSDAYVEDKVTGELHRPHHIDLKTGMYRGKQILKIKERIWTSIKSVGCQLCVAIFWFVMGIKRDEW